MRLRSVRHSNRSSCQKPRRTHTPATMKTRIVAAMPPGVMRSDALLIGLRVWLEAGRVGPESTAAARLGADGRDPFRTAHRPCPFPPHPPLAPPPPPPSHTP